MATQAKTIEAKKDEFRAYLEKTGVVDQLTKVLVSLYEETDKPTNPLEFIKRNMREENEKLRQRVTELQKQIEALKGDEGN